MDDHNPHGEEPDEIDEELEAELVDSEDYPSAPLY